MKRTSIILLACLAVTVVIILLLVIQNRAASKEKISRFGEYQGYSNAIYDGAQRSSDYLTLSDGTRLAYDLFLPTEKGIPAEKPLPVLFKYTPYGRAWTVFDKDGNFGLAGIMPWYFEPMLRVRAWIVPQEKGKIMDALFKAEWLGEMVNSGYAVIVVDRPGTGASFGKFAGDPEIVANETDEILDWIAAQKWSDGNIGMFGDSIQAQIQFRAASTGNPHLKAILPATTWMDNYSAVVFPGGIQDKAMTDFYAKVNVAFDSMATPVDQDTDGALLAQARNERNAAVALAEGMSELEDFPYRDSLASDGRNFWVTQSSLYPLLDRINRSGIPVYLINGWYDIYARDNFLIYDNLTVPKRLLVRPADHAGIESPASDIDYGAEAHRWFDYWLKSIDNGIMNEPPIHYYLQGVEKDQAWQGTDVWPLREQIMQHYYFGPGDAAGKASVNNGVLVSSAPTESKAFDVYTVNYSTTTGPTPLWTGLATEHEYPNMRFNDIKSLTYTTTSLNTAFNLTGHPIVHLWLSTDTPDLDAFVYLEEVDGSGNSIYISEGCLRASHRTLGVAPFGNFGLPWHNHYQSELMPIPSRKPIELIFDLRPTAWVFSPGKRMRITLAFSDANNFYTPILNPAPIVQILRDVDHTSYVEIPTVQYP